jgi:hypothetical protein
MISDGRRVVTIAAAVVLKSLHELATVIHHLSLRGGSGVPHQIDVVIGVEGPYRSSASSAAARTSPSPSTRR